MSDDHSKAPEQDEQLATVRAAAREPIDSSEERQLREQKLISLLPSLTDAELDLVLRTVESLHGRKS